MKYLMTLATSFTLVSCATVKTLDPKDSHVNIQHQGKNSYCESIPRVYSGAAYNVCKVTGEPSTRKNVGNSINGVPIIVIDAFCSVAADTLVLPYTIFRQVNDGNIAVN
jgi:uncharacterized protein YceK